MLKLKIFGQLDLKRLTRNSNNFLVFKILIIHENYLRLGRLVDSWSNAYQAVFKFSAAEDETAQNLLDLSSSFSAACIV